MGKRRGVNDVAFKTHEAYYDGVRDEFNALLIENVPNYQISLVQQRLGPKWQTKHAVIDPRNFGIPCARSRLYVLAWRRDSVRWRQDVDLAEALDILSARTVAGAAACFWKNDLPPSSLTPAQVS